jgi:type VI secretion system protein ImpC
LTSSDSYPNSPLSSNSKEKQSPTSPSEFQGSILEDLISLAGIAPEGLEDFLRALEPLLSTQDGLSLQSVSKANLEIDSFVSLIDRNLSKQLDAILHNQDFIDLERAWRSLKFLIDRVDFRENIKIEILNVSKSELRYDLTDSPELTRSALYRKVYTAEYGQFGGQPFGAVIAAYEVGANPADMATLKNLAALGAMAHVPFICSVDRSFFGLSQWNDFPSLEDFDSLFHQPRYAAWQALRRDENSRYLALALPGFLTRLPYCPQNASCRSFNYLESASQSDDYYVWGYASFLIALKMCESFVKYRWCAYITGLNGGGLIEDLPSLNFEAMGRSQNRISLRAVIGESLEKTLADNGFIAVSVLESRGKAAIYSAPSVLKAKRFSSDEGGAKAELNYRVSTLLPYMMIVNRLTHYIKVIQRENIGAWKDRQVLEKELNAWLNQYVTDMENPSPAIRGRRPLRAAKIEVYDVEGFPGWRKMNVQIRPHLKFMGASFTLSLVGRLDEGRSGVS